MPRGDIRWQRFLINNPNGVATPIEFTNIYFTVKKSTKDRTYLFQKTLKNGNIFRLNDGDYELKIDAADTNMLAYGDYKFDIQLVYKNLLKESFVGDFVVTDEVTYYENESGDEDNLDAAFHSEPHQGITIIEIPDYHEIELTTPDIIVASSYIDLSDKPAIGGVTLQGEMSLDELGIQPAGNYPSDAFTEEEIDELLAEEEG